MRFGSLFAGIGGFDLGLERAGMTCAWQVENDPYARRVLAKHWPDVTRYGDIREVNWNEVEPVDLICGGFPCQDISNAGKKVGISGERSGLWLEYARCIRELRPRYILVENVAALLARGMGDVLGALAALGYNAEWHCVQAAAAGAPHLRDRVWIFGYADSDSQSARPVNAEARRMPPPPSADTHRAGTSHARAHERVGRLRIPPDAHLPGGDVDLGSGGHHWSVEPRVGRVADGVPARLDRLRGLGNAVVPQVAEFLGRAILAAQGAA